MSARRDGHMLRADNTTYELIQLQATQLSEPLTAALAQLVMAGAGSLRNRPHVYDYAPTDENPDLPPLQPKVKICPPPPATADRVPLWCYGRLL